MEQALAAVGAFAGTNVDDVIVLAVLFTTSHASGRPRPWQLWAGQYLGIALLVAVSIVAALGLAVVPDRWIGLLGLIPLALGLRGFYDNLRAGDADEPQVPAVAGVASVAAVTIANGADNVSIYTPLFRTAGVADSLLTVGIFGALVAVWCLVGSYLGSRPRVVGLVERFGHWLVPGVFVAIGVTILAGSGPL